MKKIRLLSSIFFLMSSSLVCAYEVEVTKPQLIKAIAVGENQAVEVSFEDMSNTQNCSYNGAFVLDARIKPATRNQILSLLIASKTASIPVRVRLYGCADRPKFRYIFSGDSWVN